MESWTRSRQWCTSVNPDGILHFGMKRTHTWRIAPGSLEYPLVLAHRGASQLAPENTLAAFHKAVEVGADGIELDVRLTKDKHVVVIHNRRVDRTTTGHGLVGTHSLEVLKSLDAGSWFGAEFAGELVPTLDEVFRAIPPSLFIYVELKVRGYGAWDLASNGAKLIRRHERWDMTMVASFNALAVGFLRVIDRRIVRGYIWSAHHPLPLHRRWLNPLASPHWLAPDRRTLTPDLLAKLHAQGNPVAAWDFDIGADIKDLAQLQLDAAVTDYPDVLVRQKFDMM